ncbi:MAG: tetratricopeptide repeat protein [Ilumatobacteraceae bacterium]
MATKSAPSRVAHKIPVALFVAAAALLTQGLISKAQQDDGPASLPDPREMTLVSLGRIGTPKVVELWRDRVAQTPNSPSFRVKLASSMLALASETGNLSLYGQAEGIARSAVQLDPENESANLTLASALAGQHGFSAALTLANNVLSRTPNSVGARIAAADSHLELGDYDVAAVAYTQLATELPGAPSILSRQARIDALTGHLEGAITLARKSLIGAGEQDFDTYTMAFYWFQMANYQYQAGRYDSAAATLRSALKVQPKHIGSIELLGKVLVAQGRYDEATKLYEDLLKRTDAADLRGELAKLYANAGRAADAQQQIDIGIKLARVAAEKFPAERRHLITFFSDHDPTTAVELARQDLQTRADVQSYGWMAWTLLQVGRADEAVTYVDKALRLGTQDAWLLYQAGSVYAAVGDTTNARLLLTQALELNPQFDLVHAQRARNLLEDLSSRA